VNINDAVVLVTGANRGIGAEFVTQLRARGAGKIYAGVRDISTFSATEGVVPLELDVTDQAQVAAAAVAAYDVQIIINNAGIAVQQPVTTGDLEKMHDEFEVNVFGPLYVARAFSDVLRINGGGTIANALSAVSWFSFPGAGSYSASKAAAWNLTDALRLELADQGTTVLGFHMGPVATEMGDLFPLDKISPSRVVTGVLDAIEEEASEVIIDDISQFIKSTLTSDPSRYALILGG
jgi:NAD(P)-dependent dehydrogenase (short-subunit alcohol dehydrogenase family)